MSRQGGRALVGAYVRLWISAVYVMWQQTNEIHYEERIACMLHVQLSCVTQRIRWVVIIVIMLYQHIASYTIR